MAAIVRPQHVRSLVNLACHRLTHLVASCLRFMAVSFISHQHIRSKVWLGAHHLLLSLVSVSLCSEWSNHVLTPLYPIDWLTLNLIYLDLIMSH